MATQNQLTDDEKKEKILLDLNYFLFQLDSGKTKKIKKNLKQIETDLKAIFNTTISSKTYKDYIQLKETKFDENLLKLSKYL